MADIVDRLERVIRRHVLSSVPPDAVASLESLSLANLLIEYRVWRHRFVAPVPRNVLISRELRKSGVAAYQAAFDAIKQKIERGEDLTPHLSTLVHKPFRNASSTRRGNRDYLLSDWGVHHLHLATTLRPNGTSERTKDVLFAIFSQDTAYLMCLQLHPKEANWADEDIFAIVVKNWPNADLVHQSFSGLTMVSKPSNEERLQLREAGVMTPMEIDGKLYVPRNMGLTTAGTSIHLTQEVNQLMWSLRSWRDGDPIERLRKTQGVRHDAYWTAAIHAPMPGFEEYCGFSADKTFVSVGRLC
jgi:hypothetical protein